MFVISALREGGAERVLAELCGLLANRGHSVEVLTLHRLMDDDYPLDPAIVRADLDVITQSTGYIDAIRNNLLRLRRVRHHIKVSDPDVVVSFLTATNVIVLLAMIFLKKPVVVSERIYPEKSDGTRIWHMVRNISYGLAHSVIVQSKPGKDWLTRNTLARKVRVIPNSVVWPVKGFSIGKDPSDYAINHRIVLAVGRLKPQKGFDQLISAFSKIVEQHPDYILCIVGSGDKRDLEEQIESLDLTQRIFLVGQVGNISEWYEAADLFVMSSLFEGFPNALAEAMAARLAVVSYDCLTGPSDLIQHGQNGLLVSVGDVNGLAKSMSELMNDQVTRDRLAANALKVVDSHHPDKIAELWEAVIFEASGRQ